ncbi:Uncharacterised protein [Brevibacterium casei]|uniref:Uncharacterized protein n=1 Tax=Brevibacterium casei TaxID=33889 RepID=A0A449DD10_9MICO|nr:Uncharacterised protein [Brevibacterium casei]
MGLTIVDLQGPAGPLGDLDMRPERPLLLGDAVLTVRK